MAEETFAWSVWSTGANAMLVFLYVFSISIAYVFGSYAVHPYVMGAIGFLVPYFSFWVLPVVLILFRAISNRNIVN